VSSSLRSFEILFLFAAFWLRAKDQSRVVAVANKQQQDACRDIFMLPSLKDSRAENNLGKQTFASVALLMMPMSVNIKSS
jgi:hypothetical protein